MLFLKKIFGIGPAVDFAKLISGGAIIIDVRSTSEYESGHINGSINIPLETLKGVIGNLKKEKPVITCCASGMRSAVAKNILIRSGFSEVYNGGGWMSLKRKIS